MKRSRTVLMLGLLVLALFSTSFALHEAEPKTKIMSSVDPEAVDLLRGALDYLHQLEEFSVQAQSTMEDLLYMGHRVDLEISSSVVISRPNKIHIERHGSQFNQIFFYNGETLTLYNPGDKVYATESAPGSIEDMFHFARDTFGISVPVSDLLYGNSFELLMEDVNFATLVGKEMVNEQECNHLLFSRPGVDFQIWIAVGGPPLIYKYVVTDTATPQFLAFTTVMRNWNLDPAVSETLFNFVPTKVTEKIVFIKAN